MVGCCCTELAGCGNGVLPEEKRRVVGGVWLAGATWFGRGLTMISSEERVKQQSWEVVGLVLVSVAVGGVRWWGLFGDEGGCESFVRSCWRW